MQSPPGTPQAVIRLRPDKLALYGMQTMDVLDTIRAANEGVPISQIYMGNHVVGLSVILQDEARDDIDDIGNIPLMNPEGKQLLLKDIAFIDQENGRSKILHASAKRIQTVTANVQGRDIESFNDELKKRITSRSLSASAPCLGASLIAAPSLPSATSGCSSKQSLTLTADSFAVQPVRSSRA